MNSRTTLNLNTLINLYQSWDGKNLLDFYVTIERHAPKAGEDDVEFRTVLGDFQSYLSNRGYVTKKIMPGVAFTSKSKGMVELKDLINKYRPIDKNAITASIFFSALLNFINKNPLIFFSIIAVVLFPVAKGMKAGKCDTATGTCEPVDSVSGQNNFCNSTRTVGTSTIFYTCTPKFRNQANHQLFDQAVEETHRAHQAITEAIPAIRCKTEEIARTKFVIEIIDEDELDPQISATFSPDKKSMQIRHSFKNDKVRRVNLAHEIHHNWLWARNILSDKAKNPLNGKTYATLYDTNVRGDFDMYVGVIQTDLNTLLQLGQIITKLKANSPISPDESLVWKKYQKRFNKIDKVEPYKASDTETVHVPESMAAKYVKSGYLTPSYQFIKSAHYKDDISIAGKEIAITMQVINSSYTNNQIRFNVQIQHDEQTRVYTPVLDALYYANKAKLMSETKAVFFVEIDAYLHEVFERTQLMFNYLFENLRQLHESRHSEEYKKCLRR